VAGGQGLKIETPPEFKLIPADPSKSNDRDARRIAVPQEERRVTCRPRARPSAGPSRLPSLPGPTSVYSLDALGENVELDDWQRR
jgi:hypothetical protein